MQKRFLKYFLLILPLLLVISVGEIKAQNTATDTNKSNYVAVPSIASVVTKVQSSVVNIFTLKVNQSRGGPRSLGPNNRRSPNNEDFFEDFFFGFPMRPPRPFKERALGSGFIFDHEGYIITNNHVVEGADEIKVKLADGQEITAEIIGRDPKTDLALIKLTKAGEYPHINFGDSDKLNIGDWLVAIGNPYGFEHTVTAGILSARGRSIGAGPYDDFLQTDAAINPGNSGGPLLNLDGEVVGINSMITIEGTGIGFAIPSKLASKIIDKLKATGRVDRGWIGVVIQQLTPDLAKGFGQDVGKGALVGDVVPDAPAAAAGIQHGDIIIEFDGHPIKEWQELTTIVADTEIGKTVNVVAVRNGKNQTFKISVAKMEDDSQESGFGPKSKVDLGITVREITPDIANKLGAEPNVGLFVESINPDSPAAEAGIQPRDIIMEIDRKPVKTVAEYQKQISNHDKDSPYVFWIRRGNQNLYFSFKF
jgi:serine protease Do